MATDPLEEAIPGQDTEVTSESGVKVPAHLTFGHRKDIAAAIRNSSQAPAIAASLLTEEDVARALAAAWGEKRIHKGVLDDDRTVAAAILAALRGESR